MSCTCEARKIRPGPRFARIAILYEEGLDISKGNLSPSNAQIFDWVDLHPEAEKAASIGRQYSFDVMCAPSVVAFAS